MAAEDGRVVATGALLERSLPGAARIRQPSKPLCNKLEAAWRDYLMATLPAGTVIRSQSLKVRLASGAFYKPDFTAWIAGRLTAWECKGPRANKGRQSGILAVKVAADQWPEVRFVLVTRQGGQWATQVVQPGGAEVVANAK